MLVFNGMLLPAYIISDTKERNKEEFLSVFGLVGAYLEDHPI